MYLWSIEDFLVLGVKVRLKDLPEKRNATWNARVPRALTARSHYGECMWKHKKWHRCFPKQLETQIDGAQSFCKQETEGFTCCERDEDMVCPPP